MRTTTKKDACRRAEGRPLSILGATLALLALGVSGTVLAGTTSALMSVRVQVQARTLLYVEAQPPSLVLTEADLARGYVEVPAVSRIRVRSNDPNGYLLAFDVTAGPFTAIEVTGLGPAARIGANGGWLVRPFAGTQPVTSELTYRFLLASNVQPGTYPWPVSLSAMPR
jgi:hypothetical protein